MRSLLRILPRALAMIWALPTTLVGSLPLLLATLTGGRASLVDGVFEAHGGWLRGILTRLPVGHGVVAVTLGHIVLATTPAALAHTRAHERVHVAQVERWGPFFLPAYALASLWALLRGRNPYRDNPFEREAFAVAEPEDGRHAARPGATGPPPSG